MDSKGPTSLMTLLRILGVFQKWTFLSPMVICLLAFYLCFALSDSEAVWALRTLCYSSGEAGFSLSCPVLKLARASLGLGSRLCSSPFLPRGGRRMDLQPLAGSHALF